MKNFKKISITALCSVAAFSLTACGNNLAGADTTYGAVIDDYKVPAGVFIAMQMDAYYEATNFIEPTNDESKDTLSVESAEETASSEGTAETEETTTTPFTDKVIEDMPVREWVNNEATKKMQEYVAIENKFEEYGLAFEDNEKEKNSIYLDSLWEYYGEYYEGLGISENSQLLVMLNSTKRDMVFDYIYGNGGEKEISEVDIRSYLEENNKRINYIEMVLKDGEGNLLKSDEKTEIKKMAEGYIERIKNGEDFSDVSKEYSDYYDKLVVNATESSDENSTSDDTAETASSYIDNETVISKDGSTPSSMVIEKAFEANTGDIFLVEEDEVYYVVAVLDLYADEDYYTENEKTARHALKDDEFDETVTSWTDSQSVEKNDAAYKRYKIEKFMN